MTSRTVVIVDTGVANIASLIAAFERLGCQIRLSAEAEQVERATHLVLPGVGAFRAGMSRLRQAGLEGPRWERLQSGRPTLAVCLGLQLLCSESEESPSEKGLGVIRGQVTRFPDTVRVPQFGWNRVVPGAESRLLRPGYAYFANSYRLTTAPEGWLATLADHGGPFVAALERGAVLACQFHPELSAGWGRALLARWLGR